MTGCPADETVLAYLERRLPEEKAAELEEHFFHCESCWREVERGIEIRSAFAHREEETAAATLGPGWKSWKLLAAAAALVVSVGVVSSLLPTSDDPVSRGSASAVEVTMEVNGSDVVLSWSSVPGAHAYIVESFRDDGRPLFDIETDVTHASIDLDARSDLPRRTFWRIQALGSVRETIASSELVELELSDER